MWSVLDQAHKETEVSLPARQQLMERYGGCPPLPQDDPRDEQAADDLTQEFALALIRGEFRKADPHRGRFRSYVKSVLVHLVGRYRRNSKAARSLPPDAEPIAGPSLRTSDQN
jgi:RNA polymerase sigma-70 factor (ECF subfamily)